MTAECGKMDEKGVRYLCLEKVPDTFFSVTSLLGEAVKLVFSRQGDLEAFDDICLQFKGGLTLQVGDEVSTGTMLENYAHIKGLKAAAARMAGKLGMPADDPASLVSAGEFILEGLYVNNRLSKVNMPGKTFFRK